MRDAISLRTDDVLLVVDPQNDFCPTGALAVPHGDEIIPSLNRLAQSFGNVVLTQDWHPAGHASFASSHPGRKAYDMIELAYGMQVLWPDHCVQASAGAAFHADLAIPHAALILRKGFHPEINSYSAFYENDRATSTGLCGLSARTRSQEGLHRRPRFRFLRPLFDGRRVRGRFPDVCGGRRLPRHRSRWLDGKGSRGHGRQRRAARHERRLPVKAQTSVKKQYVARQQRGAAQRRRRRRSRMVRVVCAHSTGSKPLACKS